MDIILERIENEIFSLIWKEIKKANLFYVENLGYRIFLRDGSSAGICTNKKWKEEKNKPGFKEIISKFYTNELLQMKLKSHSFSVRVQGQAYCQFMEKVSSYGLGNVGVLHRFFDDKIVAYYFVANGHEHYAATYFNNDRPTIEKIIDNLHEKIEAITRRYTIEDYATPLLPYHVLSELFPILTKRKRLFEHTEESIIFTEKQEEIIYLLTTGCKKSKEIARRVCLSPSGVDYHIHKLIELLHLESRNDLVNYAKQLSTM